MHITHQASVPVSLDFAKKLVTFHQEVEISSDIENELKKFKEHYADVCAKKTQVV